MRTFGIEIEMVGRRAEVAEAVRSVVGGTVVPGVDDDGAEVFEVRPPSGPPWKVEDDDSLGADPAMRAELVSPPLSREDLALVERVVAAVRDAGAVVNGSCGVHVHIGASSCSVEQMCALVDLLTAVEPVVMEGTFGISESRRRFTEMLDPDFLRRFRERRPTTYEELWELWYGARDNLTRRRNRYDQSRYRGLNLHSHAFRGTVEFRYFDATLDPVLIRLYVRTCIAIADRAEFPE